MQPLKPDEKEEILEATQADPADIAEYERLLAEMFMVDPDAPPADPALESLQEDKQKRLEELAQKLFPNGIKQG